MREKRYDERKKWRILYAIVIAALLIGSGLMISAELISERDNFHSLNATNRGITANEISNIKLEGLNLNKNSSTHIHTAYFQRDLTRVSIFTLNYRDGYSIFTFVNNRIASWVIYHNNEKTGIVHISAMVNGKISAFSQKVNETNVSGTIYTSNISNHVLASKSATAKPGDAAYSMGIFGWAASFTNRELSIIAYALGAGATIAGIVALFATGTIVGIPVAFVFGVASAIMGIGALIIGGLALACSNGGYIGMGIGGLVFGCNPVPWYY